jgi:hypothetical protein
MFDNKYREAVRGDCYYASYLLLECLDRIGESDFRLCHGIAVLTAPPFGEFGHAWLELGSVCIAHQFPDRPTPRERFYKVGQIREHTVKRYTAFEARQLIRRYRHYGPWCDIVAQALHR